MKPHPFLISLLLALLMPWSTTAQETVTIGDGTQTDYYLPINTYYEYSLTQQIYLASQIGLSGTIQSIAFYYDNTTAYTMSGLQVYMLNTEKTAFSSNTDMVPVAPADKVFDGDFVLPSSPGWAVIQLDTPFEYDDSYNLLICLYDPTEGYQDLSAKFRYTVTPDGSYKSLERHSDTFIPDLNDINNFQGSSTRYDRISNIQITITTSASTCLKPATLQASQVTGSSATLAWTEGSGVYTMQYKKTADENWTTALNNSTLTSFNLTGLEENTGYQVRVQSVCGAETSEWRSLSFTTIWDVPFVETFETNQLPDGWGKYRGSLEEVLAGGEIHVTNSGWNFNTGNGVFDNHAMLRLYNTPCNYWLVSPSIAISDHTQLTFDVALTYYAGQLLTPNTNGIDDKFAVLVTTDEGDTWSLLRLWDNAGSEYVLNNINCSTWGEEAVIDLSDYAGQRVSIAFYGESTANNADNLVHIDNVSFNPIPSCAKPTHFTAVADKLDVTMTWTGDAESYDVAVSSKEGSTPDEAIYATNINGTSFNCYDLPMDTDCYFWVRAHCGGNDYSEWTHPVILHIGYCVPVSPVADGEGIIHVNFGFGGEVVDNYTSDITVGNFSDMVGAVTLGVASTISITYGTGVSYGTIIWVDLDRSFTYDDDEILYTGMSHDDIPTTLNASITIPGNQALGDYRLRIGGANGVFDDFINGLSSDAPEACFVGGFACFQDYTLRVVQSTSVQSMSDEDRGFALVGDGQVIVNATDARGASLQVTDVTGRILLNRQVTSTFCIPTSFFPSSGLFLFRLTEVDGVRAQKVFIP